MNKILELKNIDEILTVVKALNSKNSLIMLKKAVNEYLDLINLASKIKKPDKLLHHFARKLEKAGLIESKYIPGIRGVRKAIKAKYSKIIINLEELEE